MFDSSEKTHILKKYIDKNGVVYLTGGDDFYAVSVEKRETPWRTSIHQRGRLDALCAGEFFDVATRFVRGEIEWTEPVRKFSCKYNPKRSCGCTDSNCSHVLGGATYREIFGKSCVYRNGRVR